MTTITYPQPAPHRPAPMLAVAALILFAVFTSHALSSHAKHVPEINHCFDGGGELSPWHVGPDGRYGRYCLENGNAYWRIAECENGHRVIVTQFKMERVRRIARYIANKQFEPIGDMPCS